jgi:CheY-like chemotaxis protein
MIAAKPENASVRPCVIIAHTDPGYAARAARAFRRLGWDDHAAADGPQVRRLARMLDAWTVVLDVDLPGETGWLTCEKLRRERAHTRVLLVGSDPTPRDQRLATFVGALALVDRFEGSAALVRVLSGTPTPRRPGAVAATVSFTAFPPMTDRSATGSIAFNQGKKT